MKKLIFILSLSMIIVMLGCSRERLGNHSEYADRLVHEVLLEAERLVEEHPDSAMVMIWKFYVQGMEPDILLGENGRQLITADDDAALFSLVYTEAIHKKGMTMHQDTLIARSLAYYERTGEEKRLCKTLIHRGLTCMDNGQLETAVGHLKRSETMAKELGDDALVYEASMALGRLNLAARCHSLMAQHYKAALSVAHQMGSNTRTALTLNSLMRAFLQFGQADSAYQYAEQAATLHQNMEPAVQAELLASMGSIKLRKHKRSEGKAMLELALKLFPSSFAALQLGNSLAAEGDTLKACDLWAEALQTMDEEVEIEALQHLVAYYENHEQWRALDLSKMLNGLLQGSRRNGTTERVAELQAQYDHEQAQRKWRRRLGLMGVGCLALGVGCWVLVAERRRRKRQYHELIQHIAELQEELNARCSTDAAEENRQQEQERAGLSTLLDSNLVYWFHRKAQVGKQPDHDDWSELHELFSQHQPLFLRAISRHEDLPDRDLHVCMLIRLRFQPTEIATLIGASPQTVTNRRTSLLSKLFGEKGGARDFDRRIREMNK